MKTTSKKRMLISSVAMLLVAMLALGTATFAWFTSSTIVTANGITVRTSKTSELQISDDTIDYSAAGFTYKGMEGIMFPASSADGSSWFYTSAADKSAFTAANTASFTPVPDATKAKYVYVNQLNILNAGEVGIKDIKITISNLTGDYIRVALVPVNSKVQGGDTTMTAENFLANIYGNTNKTAPDNTSYYPVASATKISTTAVTPKSDRQISVTTGDEALAGGAEKHYNLFVWFEGQDAKCYDTKAGQGVTNLSFAVAGTPVIETE